MAKTFPELTHTKHTPTGERPHFVKRSEHADAGHNDSMNRMTPFGEFPNSGTGEGTGSPRPSGQRHPFNE
jgi:hypothetical protein